MSESAWQHIYPVNDIVPHDTESKECVCGPEIDWNNQLVVHHSLDGREKREKHIYLRKAGTMTYLCHKGTMNPIDFDSIDDAQSYLDSNENPDNDYEIVEVTLGDGGKGE